MEEPQAVHKIAPENLSPDMAPPLITAYTPKAFPRARKVELVADLMRSGLSTAQFAEKLSREGGVRVSPPQVRGWLQGYTVEATQLLKARGAEHLLGAPPPNAPGAETRVNYTPQERRILIGQYHASGLGLDAGADLVGVPRDTLRKWLAAEAAIGKHYSPRKSVAGPGANISDATRQAAIDKILSGVALKAVASELLVSEKSVRIWFEKHTGRKLKAREVKRLAMETKAAEAPSAPAAKSRPKDTRVRDRVHSAGGIGKKYTDKEKILFAVRYLKFQIDNYEEGARRLGVSATALRKWVTAFKAYNPQKRMHLTREADGKLNTNDHIPNEEKEKALKAVERGELTRVVADKYKVHPSTIRNWWGKFRSKETWPYQSSHPKGPPDSRVQQVLKMLAAGEHYRSIAQKLGVHGDSIKAWWTKANPGKSWVKTFNFRAVKGPPKPRTVPEATGISHRAPVIARIAAGELFSDVSEELGIQPGTLRAWWRAIKGNSNWPKQYGIKNSRGRAKPVRMPNGPQQKTIARRELVQTAGAELLNPAEELNGVEQPLSTGKATHDAIVFLRLAREEFQKAIKAGNMRIDDPIMLFPMLALHTLNR